MEFKEKREEMVETQIKARGVSDKRVLEAMLKVPRHRFVSEPYVESAYRDGPLPIGCDQTISQPYMVAVMLECLGLKGEERVLEIGTGSGYQAAILAELAKEVYTIERHPELARRASLILKELGYINVQVIRGNGSEGLPEYAPYHGIIVAAGAPSVPQSLVDQLAEGGRLAIPLGSLYLQALHVVEKTKEGETIMEKLFDCTFVPLVGKGGWKEDNGKGVWMEDNQ